MIQSLPAPANFFANPNQPILRRTSERTNPRMASAPPAGADLVAVFNLDSGGLSGRKRRIIAETLRKVTELAPRRILYADGANLTHVLNEATSLSPKAVLVCGGDGTARTAIETLTPLGIATAPLPGGTLNRLSAAVYGETRLNPILQRIQRGRADWIPAGRIGSHRFYVVSGFGAWMRLNRVRESLRAGDWGAAWRHFREISEHVLDQEIEVNGSPQRAHCAIVALGPVDAAFGLRPPDERNSFEVASASLNGWSDALTLAPFAVVGGWRVRRNVTAGMTRMVTLKVAADSLHALLDGEAVMLPNEVAITYEEHAGLVWR